MLPNKHITTQQQQTSVLISTNKTNGRRGNKTGNWKFTGIIALKFILTELQQFYVNVYEPI